MDGTKSIATVETSWSTASWLVRVPQTYQLVSNPVPEQATQNLNRPSVYMPHGPAALTWEQAVAYTGMAPSELRRHVASKRIVFRKIGVGGKMIVPRTQLIRLLDELFGDEDVLAEDFEFAKT